MVSTKIANKNLINNIGILFKKSISEIILAHNFSHITPIDITKIPIKDIIKIIKVIPVEINSLKQIDSNLVKKLRNSNIYHVGSNKHI